VGVEQDLHGFSPRNAAAASSGSSSKSARRWTRPAQ
jgi:hypothetical protein